ncbi:hypothetical protein [Psittacicella hinzii]|uniref:Uncharacterized protein n=1 Tax=Psittacicella hinzii TaxID=2028575 RepID=A0A3A1YR05_9GAMM|nr:hypothetical protein [Psittacicella hinzii]RIY39370.1 hypothetical protein CKF58_02310 [Psittacicella hinzii]
MKIPCFMLDKYFLDQVVEVRQAGQMMLSFIFSFEDDCKLVFANRGILNFIDFTQKQKILALKEKYPKVYNYIWGKYLNTDSANPMDELILMDRMQIMTSQWAMLAFEHESDEAIAFILDKSNEDYKILQQVVSLMQNNELPMINCSLSEYLDLTKVEFKKYQEQFSWVYKG